MVFNFNLFITSLYIYFDDLEYTLVSQRPKTELIDLIANVGGLLGLFTGFTFLFYFP